MMRQVQMAFAVLLMLTPSAIAQDGRCLAGRHGLSWSWRLHVVHFFAALPRFVLVGAGTVLDSSSTISVTNRRTPCSSKSITVWRSLLSMMVPGPY